MAKEITQIKSKMFPVPLYVEAIDDSDTEWKVVHQDFYCEDPVLGRIDVAVGTITDFGSIPKSCQSLISPTNRYRKPFVIHDQNYTTQKFNQKQSDACLLRGMKERDQRHNKISPWYKRKFGLERSTIYTFLRLFGWFAWNRHAAENKKKLNERP